VSLFLEGPAAVRLARAASLLAPRLHLGQGLSLALLLMLLLLLALGKLLVLLQRHVSGQAGGNAGGRMFCSLT
jgi:hypothetical protein